MPMTHPMKSLLLAALLSGAPLLQAADGKDAAGATAGAQATLHWARRVELGTPVSGVVAEVLVEVGDRVGADQVLLRLDPRRFEAEVARARAEVRRLELARGEAKQELERAEELYARTVISAHDLEQAKIDFAAADAEYASAHAAATQARMDLQDSAVRSPIDGVVVQRRAEVGQTVVSRLESRPLLVVADNTAMVARARLGADAVALVRPGQQATVEVGGRRYTGNVSELGLEPVEEFGSPEYSVGVSFSPVAEAPLRAGLSATVEFK
ncbi:MAG: efflux RND transporter periplasmic adaptor subunit [Gammaproteobacteria bacterium]|nr:efflux RND transporter periplasmic adaptor subunit [Gammaproteobacteria bacterium]